MAWVLALLALWPGPGTRLKPLDRAELVPEADGTVLVGTPAGSNNWSGVRIVFDPPVDLSSVTSLRVRCENAGSLARPLRAEVRTCADGPKPVAMKTLELGEETELRLALKTMPWTLDAPLPLRNMKECPRCFVGLDHVTELRLFYGPPGGAGAFALKSVTADVDEPSRVLQAKTFLPFVDRYGQFVHADWPGKIRSDEDLRRIAQRERDEQEAMPTSPVVGVDAYGGWGAGPKLKATGHFRTEKVDGKWWLVDPAGRLFFSQGLCCVRAGEESPVFGRETYFETPVPEKGDYPRANLKRKYGAEWETAFSKETHRRLRSWGFNTLGMWSDERLCRDGKTPYVVTSGTRGPAIPGSGGGWGPVPDPFSREFKDHLERLFADERRSGRAEDPWCIGYFLDNELSWDSLAGDPVRMERYAEEYFRSIRTALKRYAPNKLYLGCRIALGGDVIKRVASKYCDVVSVNSYRRSPDCDLPPHSFDKPVLVGEFHFGSFGRGLFNTGCVQVESRAAAAKAFEDYMSVAHAHPRCVGAHWFQWRDEPLAGRFDGENFGIGFVSATDEPYAELVVAARRVAARTYPVAGEIDLDGEWTFSHDNRRWRQVKIPHDWAIGGPFDPDAAGATGKLPWCGEGWYGRYFNLDAVPETAYLEFDGVMARPQVFLNGSKAGGWNYGYSSFRLEITRLLKTGDNHLVVYCDTRNYRPRWYPGAGIFRSVRLKLRSGNHIVPDSVRIATSEITEESARVEVSCVWSKTGPSNFVFRVESPRLWDIDDPFLYALELDGRQYRYGIRTAEFTADDGFRLNGRRVDLKGVNLHSDLGILGAAYNVSADRRRLEKLKAMGANAIRTSHNPVSPQTLDLCDELGLVVWNECFDKWDETSGRLPSEDLDAFVEQNLRSFIKRDRNHPSVVVWSIGNEIWADRDFNGRHRTDGMSRDRCARFASVVRSEDPTRPVGCGNCFGDAIAKGCFDALDVTGWNYDRNYVWMRRAFPRKPVVYSESASALSSIGQYALPPEGDKTAYDVGRFEISSWYHCAGAPWNDIPEVEFERMKSDRYCAGEFVWTGMDYLGEPTPYAKGLPGMGGVAERDLARSSYFGILDITGGPKDRYWLYRSVWRPETVTVHILPHWNWFVGQKVPVYVYTSGDSAELFLNGRSLGLRRKGDAAEHPSFLTNAYYDVSAKYRLRWFDVPYEPGELKAVAFQGGRRIGAAVMGTCRDAVRVKLIPDRGTLPADGKTLAFVSVRLMDDRGMPDPLSTARVKLSLVGPGEIVAVGNGNPRGTNSFAAVDSHPLYAGRMTAVVRRFKGAEGPVCLSAEAEGGLNGSCTFP